MFKLREADLASLLFLICIFLKSIARVKNYFQKLPIFEETVFVLKFRNNL